MLVFCNKWFCFFCLVQLSKSSVALSLFRCCSAIVLCYFAIVYHYFSILLLVKICSAIVLALFYRCFTVVLSLFNCSALFSYSAIVLPSFQLCSATARLFWHCSNVLLLFIVGSTFVLPLVSCSSIVLLLFYLFSVVVQLISWMLATQHLKNSSLDEMREISER